jgi:hypothetical protein
MTAAATLDFHIENIYFKRLYQEEKKFFSGLQQNQVVWNGSGREYGADFCSAIIRQQKRSQVLRRKSLKKSGQNQQRIEDSEGQIKSVMERKLTPYGRTCDQVARG